MAKKNEQPEHEVKISPFCVGKNLVTQDEWEHIMGRNPSTFRGKDLPVDNVSWNDIQTFITKLNSETSLNYRMLTEAEWEFLASEYKTLQSVTPSNLLNHFWFKENSDNSTHSVGTKQPSSLGVYDLLGNVWEWCSDWYDESYYKKSPGYNPPGPHTGNYKVLRGGSWFDSAGNFRATYRHCAHPDNRTFDYGFRLCRDISS